MKTKNIFIFFSLALAVLILWGYSNLKQQLNNTVRSSGIGYCTADKYCSLIYTKATKEEICEPCPPDYASNDYICGTMEDYDKYIHEQDFNISCEQCGEEPLNKNVGCKCVNNKCKKAIIEKTTSSDKKINDFVMVGDNKRSLGQLVVVESVLNPKPYEFKVTQIKSDDSILLSYYFKSRQGEPCWNKLSTPDANLELNEDKCLLFKLNEEKCLSSAINDCGEDICLKTTKKNENIFLEISAKKWANCSD